MSSPYLVLKMLQFTYMDELGLIKEKLKKAQLSSEEFAMWSAILEVMDEDDLRALSALVNLDATAIRVATNNLTAKQKSIDTENIDEWKSILENERKIVETV